MFKIPAAPKGIPVSFDGHYYARDGEELVPLNLEKIERIRAQATTEDWSIAIIPDAAFEDLDQELLIWQEKTTKVNSRRKQQKWTLGMTSIPEQGQGYH